LPFSSRKFLFPRGNRDSPRGKRQLRRGDCHFPQGNFFLLAANAILLEENVNCVEEIAISSKEISFSSRQMQFSPRKTFYEILQTDQHPLNSNVKIAGRRTLRLPAGFAGLPSSRSFCGTYCGIYAVFVPFVANFPCFRCGRHAFEVFSKTVARLDLNPRRLLFLALICVTIWTQYAAAAELCPQAHAPNDYCAVCHLGVLPFLQVSISVIDAPTLLVERLSIFGEVQWDGADHRTPGVSRAPPVQS
jgi:hypothetical protein